MITACAHGAAPPSQAPTAPVKPPPVASSTEETSLQEVLLREVKKVLGTAQSDLSCDLMRRVPLRRKHL